MCPKWDLGMNCNEAWKKVTLEKSLVDDVDDGDESVTDGWMWWNHHWLEKTAKSKRFTVDCGNWLPHLMEDYIRRSSGSTGGRSVTSSSAVSKVKQTMSIPNRKTIKEHFPFSSCYSEWCALGAFTLRELTNFNAYMRRIKKEREPTACHDRISFSESFYLF